MDLFSNYTVEDFGVWNRVTRVKRVEQDKLKVMDRPRFLGP